MFESKNLKKKLSIALAVAFIGVGVGGINSTEAATSKSSNFDYNTGTTSYDDTFSSSSSNSKVASYKLQEPKNIKTISLNAKVKPYFVSNFPIQKVGTTKKFNTSKSSGSIKYTASTIILTENVNIKNPQFTYIKKLPNWMSVKDIKQLSSKNRGYGVVSTTGWGYVEETDTKWKYSVSTEMTSSIEYVNKTTARVVINIPNDAYEQQKKKINDAGFKKFLADQDKKKEAKIKKEIDETYSNPKPVYESGYVFNSRAEYEKTLKQAKTEVTNITKQKTASDKTLSQYKTEKTQLDKKLTTAKSEQDKLQKQLTSLQAQNKKKSTSALKKQITQVQNKINTIKKENTSTEKQITTLQSKIKTEQTKNNSLKKKQQTAKAKVTDIEKNSHINEIICAYPASSR